MLATDVEVARTRRTNRYGYLWGMTRKLRNEMSPAEFNGLVADIKASLLRDLHENGFEPNLGSFKLNSQAVEEGVIMYEVSVYAHRTS